MKNSYLSEGFEGGETTFFPGDKKASWKAVEPGIEHKVCVMRLSLV